MKSKALKFSQKNALQYWRVKRRGNVELFKLYTREIEPLFKSNKTKPSTPRGKA